MPRLVRSSAWFRAERRRAREVGFAAGEAYAAAVAARPGPDAPLPDPPLDYVDAEARHLQAIFEAIRQEFLRRTARARAEVARIDARLAQAEADRADAARVRAEAGAARVREAARRAALEGVPVETAAAAAASPVAVGRWTLSREWAVGAMVFLALADCYFGFLSFQVLAPGLPALLGGVVFAAVCAWLAEVVGQRAALHGWGHADVRLGVGFLGVLVAGAAVLRAIYAGAAGSNGNPWLLFAGFLVVLGGIAFAIVELAVHTEPPGQHDPRRRTRLQAGIDHQRALAATACAQQRHLAGVLIIEWRGGFHAACMHHGLAVPPQVAEAERRLPDAPGPEWFAPPEGATT